MEGSSLEQGTMRRLQRKRKPDWHRWTVPILRRGSSICRKSTGTTERFMMHLDLVTILLILIALILAGYLLLYAVVWLYLRWLMPDLKKLREIMEREDGN